MSAVNGAALSRDLMVELLDCSSWLTHLVLVSAERGDSANVATFDEGELVELIGLPPNHRGRSPQGQLRRLIWQSVRNGWFLPGSTETEVRLHAEHIVCHGIPVAGSRYGALTVINEVRSGVLCCRCDCGAVVTYDERHLVSRIAVHCRPGRAA